MGRYGERDYMTFENLLLQFILWGKIVKPKEIGNYRNYLSQMLKRNRVIIISQNDEIKAILCFFLAHSAKEFDNRPLWSCPPDSEDGNIFFVDKMIAETWNPSIRRYLQNEIENRFPQVTEAFWLREPKNRNVIIKRRGTYVYS